MMRAAGFSNEKEFFKAVEAGQVMSDVLPKFALELRKMAREGGALDKVLGKTRAELNRFLSDLTRAKDAIFQGGMDEGLGYMFGNLSQIMKDFAPAAKAFGGAFKGAISAVTGALKVLLSPLNVVVDLFASLGFTDKQTGAIWQIVGGGGALALMAMKIMSITKGLKLMNISLAMTGMLLAKLAAAFLIVEDIYVSAKGGNGYSRDAYNASMSAPKYMDWFAPVALAKLYNQQYGNKTQVEVTVKDGEFSKAIEAKVVEGNQKQQANLASETGG